MHQNLEKQSIRSVDLFLFVTKSDHRVKFLEFSFWTTEGLDNVDFALLPDKHIKQLFRSANKPYCPINPNAWAEIKFTWPTVLEWSENFQVK